MNAIYSWMLNLSGVIDIAEFGRLTKYSNIWQNSDLMLTAFIRSESKASGAMTSDKTSKKISFKPNLAKLKQNYFNSWQQPCQKY